jgi:UDP-N-acetylglucosamine--N-acetylmuramyl-(pentapeptide) pyrophosphoryl-undecaprenol N-acetylglucosamine transferase
MILAKGKGLPPAMVQDGCIRIVPYIYDMPAALAAADLVVGRAGALSIAEITARGLPAILIPFPYAAENHQEKNARVLRSRPGRPGFCSMGSVNGESWAISSSTCWVIVMLLAKMAIASKSLGKANATPVIADRIAELAGWS